MDQKLDLHLLERSTISLFLAVRYPLFKFRRISKFEPKIYFCTEYFVGDLRSHTEYMNGRLPCAVHLPTGTTGDQIDQLREDGDISPDIWVLSHHFCAPEPKYDSD
jgi:hypothetical protein